jgi:protein-export membrane protein SecD
MDRNLRWRVILVVTVVVIGLWALYPSYRVYYDSSFADLPASEQAELRSTALGLGLDLQGGMDLTLEVDMSEIEDGISADDVMERALAVLRNRVDEFGVTEPIIQKVGDRRISVQLAGLNDPIRARRIVQQAARLEFTLVKEPEDINRTLRLADRHLGLYLAGRPAPAATDSAAADSLLAAADSLASGSPLLSRYIPLQGGDNAFSVDDVDYLDNLFEESKLSERLPNARLAWGKEVFPLGGKEVRNLYVLDERVELTGEGVERAIVRVSGQDGLPEVELNFATRPAAKFAQVTGRNVGRRLAIVLDGKVATAPYIRNRISGGRASISGGGMDMAEASDLKVVLEAGALPAPLNIIEERTVGPSLGADSIRQGVRAVMIGGVAVAIFMVVYYRASGLVSVLALVLNLFIVLAVMGRLGATLTLPGIAGLVLTIGMAVDANVLIFERIREELAQGKTVGVAISRGFDQAFSSIFDANLTTLIAAIVLLKFGAGPIRGFAVTLSIGIVANLFTAYVVSRMVFDAVAGRRQLSKLSI